MNLLLPFPASRRELVPPVTRVRGAWLASSVRAIRGYGRYDVYLEKLGREHRGAVQDAGASGWLPIDVLVGHYAACDQLDFAPFELVAIGAEAVRHSAGSLVATLTKLAAGTEATPWTVLGQSQRLWDRVFIGGGICVTRLGPREARVDLVGFPGWRFRYSRIGMRGVLAGLTEMYCAKAFVQEIATTPTSGALRIAWA